VIRITVSMDNYSSSVAIQPLLATWSKFSLLSCTTTPLAVRRRAESPRRDRNSAAIVKLETPRAQVRYRLLPPASSHAQTPPSRKEAGSEHEID